ncbi:M14 family zinc carboxypeptidase [Egicoccus halophilus]|uniref:Zinc carboxypeptidase n=1 Tax=Egicoccus halophilus TaxID=1670830 RepID=A0A8J3A9J4_9ACTN|nr:M14 family zinc carboxypeptidase [Egicoccus halophilus]GGI08096.1 hypothetical protein GCM10011354_27390 [Egicoccus halophilus]
MTGGAEADPTAPDDEELVFPGLPTTKLALIEVESYTALSNLETFHQIDLAHWHDQVDDGRVRSAAFVTDEEIEILEGLGVHIEDVSDLPTPEEAEDEFLGSIEQTEIEDLISRQQAEQRELELKMQALQTTSATSYSTAFLRSAAAADLELAAVPPPVDDTEFLRVLRADTFTNYSGNFLSIEVRSLFDDTTSANARDDRMEISYEEDGETTTRTLNVFSDAGQYIYHRVSRPVLVRGGTLPDTVEVRLFERLRDAEGELTGEEELLEELVVPTSTWAPYDEIGYPEGFQYGFVPGYLDSVDSTNAITLLHEQYPELTDLVELPNQTNGYQRKAMLAYVATNGTPGESTVNVESLDWGHEGGNQITFEILDTGVAGQDLGVVRDTAGSGNNQRQIVRVTPATDGDGVVTSTAAEVIAAINASDEVNDLVRAFTYRGSEGGGVVPTLGQQNLSDHLNAPTHKIDRGPRDVYMLRIGAHRDGSKTGVFAYSQEHAREWVTPVVAVETATRLLRNYGTDPLTTELVDNLDIFIIPTVNRDGTDYSRYDNTTQRRNLTRYCDELYSDVNARNAWGVDLNRNFARYSLFDGYSGASTSCVSDVFAGPNELSEPEAQNSVWVVEQNPNIRFSMNIHTHGGYFMWAPGTYRTPGRIPAPRPDLGVEEFFFEASETILGRIAEHRGTVIEPGRTGPIIDVLYSAAGNSADHFWYDGLEEGRPVFGWSFEAGANVYTGQGNTGWVSPGGFFPTFMDEGWNQSMEFANGIYGMLEVALEFEQDDQAPTTRPNVRGDVNYDGAADVFFASDEPATVHYTTDGTTPTTDSPTVQRWGHDTHPTGGARDSAEPISLDETTTLKWFGVDVAGNEEAVRELTVYIDEEPPFVADACTDVAPLQFPDVTGGRHADNIRCIGGLGISQGNTDGEYMPGSDVRRDQMATFIANMLRVAGVQLPASPDDAFGDDGGHHELAINQLAELGIVQGRSEGVYAPGRAVTREQMTSFLVNSLEYILDEELAAEASAFTDIAASRHFENIEIAAHLGITQGTTPTTFGPGQNVRRDQMGSFIKRSLDVLAADGYVLTPVR